MAYRYNAIDNDNDNEKLTAVLNAIRSLLRGWGAKNLKDIPYKRAVDPPKKKNTGDIVTGAITNLTVTEVVQ